MKDFGEINTVSVDGSRKSAIARFRNVETAGKVYLHFRENDPETGRRRKMLGDGHPDA